MTLTARGLRVGSDAGRRPRIDGIDLEVPLGTVTVLVGPNGAGKSSLLSCLGGLLRPDDGTVAIDERPLTAFSRRELARTVAYVSPWSATDVSLTVSEVVSLGRLAHRQSLWEDPLLIGRTDVERALSTVDLGSMAEAPLRSLSAGERQRARLAAALAQEAPYLLLDEPTASLDPGHARHLLDLVGSLATAGQTVVMALHDLTAAAQYADTVVLMDQGRVVRTGPPQEVIRPDVLEPVYATAFAVIDHPHTGHPVVVAAYDAGPRTSPHATPRD